MRTLALVTLAGCAASAPRPALDNVDNRGGHKTEPPWAPLFERGRAWTLPVTVTTTPEDGPASTRAAAAVTCRVVATATTADDRRARITCTDPDHVLASYALPVGYLVATDAGLSHYPDNDGALDEVPAQDPDFRVMRWPLVAFSQRIGQLEAFETYEAWSDGADLWCAVYYGQAGDRGGAELCLDAGGIRSARQWMSEDGTTDVVLGAHRLPPRPALTTVLTSLPQHE
ncbi:MAG: hypothetical protein K8W52_35695 [Deltaproteobacteria bacterium]|nr:hypothetical protein [Deltaproteobacteria bacterium]